GRARRGEELIFPLDFDADKVDARAGRRLGEQEQPLAEADLDLDRVGVAEHAGPVVRRRRRVGGGGGGQEGGRRLLRRQAGGAGHGQPPSPASTAGPWRWSGTPRTSPWKTMVPATNPWTLKTVCRRFRRSALPTSTSRSPGRTGLRKRTFSRPPKPRKSPCKR